MKDKVFVDTNIFVYAYTNGDMQKHNIVKQYFESSQVRFVISTQVLNELYVSLTKYHIVHDNISDIITEIASFCQVSAVGLGTVNGAVTLKKRYGFSYWDSLILSAAIENGCQKIFTEGMQDGQLINNTIRIVNMFKHPQ